MVPLSGARVITEIDALQILTGVQSFHVASGGSSGSEGAVTLVTEGNAVSVEKAIQLIESIKGTPPLAPRKGICSSCVPKSPAEPTDYEMEEDLVHCCYQGKAEEDLPEYLRNR
jgi:hypothetical protein